MQRPELPPCTAALLDDFEDPAALGASRQLSTAASLISALALEHQGDSAALAQDVRAVTSYLISLRGESSQAIPNALGQMLANLDAWTSLPLTEFRQQLQQSASGYAQRAQAERDRVTEYGLRLAASAKRILAYDYSSSVAAILAGLDESSSKSTLIIPEARSLNGGRRFLEDLRGSTLPIEFVPDAAITTALKDCDLALIGAETIGADGSCYNTVGSLGVALACDYWRVPLYVPSTLIKLDTRTLFGYQRPMPALDQQRLSPLTADWPATLRSRATVLSPDLDRVPPVLIAAYITEFGLLPPSQIAAHAARLAEALPHD